MHRWTVRRWTVRSWAMRCWPARSRPVRSCATRCSLARRWTVRSWAMRRVAGPLTDATTKRRCVARVTASSAPRRCAARGRASPACTQASCRDMPCQVDSAGTKQRKPAWTAAQTTNKLARLDGLDSIVPYHASGRPEACRQDAFKLLVEDYRDSRNDSIDHRAPKHVPKPVRSTSPSLRINQAQVHVSIGAGIAAALQS